MPDPVLWLTGAIAALAGFTALLVKQFIAHLESDLAYSRKTAHRGTELAEESLSQAEKS